MGKRKVEHEGKDKKKREKKAESSSSSDDSSSDSSSEDEKEKEKEKKKDKKKEKEKKEKKEKEKEKKEKKSPKKDKEKEKEKKKGKVVWQFKGTTWVNFEKPDSSLLEEAFSEGAKSFTTTKLTFNKKEDTYLFDFKKMKQINKKTDKEREIRRRVKKTKKDIYSESESASSSDSDSSSSSDSDSDDDKKKVKAKKEKKEKKSKKEKKEKDSKKKKKKGKSSEEIAAIKKQAHFGAQSKRGLTSVSYGPAVTKDPHGKECFDKLFENETRLCGEWAVFYHSYSFAALIYEVNAAVAAVLFRFKSTFASLPRLLMEPFSELGTADDLMKKIKACGSDHDVGYRKVGICASTSLVSADPEATPKDIFLSGYSCTDVSFMGVLEDLLTKCHVPKPKVKSLAKEIVSLSEKYGLDLSQFGGKACKSGRPGHLLQIFVKRTLVDKYIYGALPYGHIDAKRQPIAPHLAKNIIIQGQVRIAANPEIFLRATAVRMFVYSADPTFHSNREKYQKKLTELLFSILGSHKTRIAAATGIYGGKLPDWFDSSDQSEHAKIENNYK